MLKISSTLSIMELIKYTIHYHKGTPSKSQVVHKDIVYSQNDISADKARKTLEVLAPEHDFNTLCQTQYLENEGL